MTKLNVSFPATCCGRRQGQDLRAEKVFLRSPMGFLSRKRTTKFIEKWRTSAAALLLGSTLAIAGCAASSESRLAADRDAINREMPLVAEYENKRAELKKAIGFLVGQGLFDGASGKQLKESMDIEYVYYEASIISLAHGNMSDYRAFVELAEKELERAKGVLTARVQALQSERAS